MNKSPFSTLQKTVLNGLPRCFGFHSKCSIDIYKTAQCQSLPASPNTASLQSAENTKTNDSKLPQQQHLQIPEYEACST